MRFSFSDGTLAIVAMGSQWRRANRHCLRYAQPMVDTPETPGRNPVHRWIEDVFVDLARQFRWSYLPPLMIYMAAGISGLTAIVGTFFVKDYLGLSAEFLAALGFWAGIPWALKMPLGHLVDLIWRWKAILVWVGAALIAISVSIMYALIAHTDAMTAIAPLRPGMSSRCCFRRPATWCRTWLRMP